MSEPNAPEPIDPSSPNHCRPADHPAHLPWMPEILDNYEAKKDVTRDKTSEKAFHYELAVEAFGKNYMERLVKEQEDFQGDWFQLAFLLRCHETPTEKRGIGEKRPGLVRIFFGDQQTCRCPFCQTLWQGIHLEEAYLGNANLAHANLEDANLTHARLWNANLTHANLRKAHLTHANLEDANCENTILAHAILDGADVRDAKGIVFDSNRVERLLIEGNAPDPWSVLRRTYTGPKFFMYLLLLVTFFLPYIGTVFFLTSIHQGMELIDRYPGTNDPALQQLQTWYQGVEKQQAVWALIGFTDYDFTTIGFLILTVIMVVYKFFRYFLTMEVNLLRDAEERAKIMPRREEYLGLFRMHQIADVLWYCVVFALIAQAVRWVFFTQIPVLPAI